MAILSSDHLKAIITTTNICENEPRIYRNNCTTLQSYRYECFRSRGNLSLPYGNMHSTILELNLKNFSENLGKYFLNSIKSPEPSEVSLIFNATFNANGELEDYAEAFVARGYVVDTQENYSTDIKKDSQRTLFIKMLLSKIIYKGEDSNLNLIISND